MGIFKKEIETKRVIFNIRLDLAEELEKAKEDARSFGKKLDVDTAVNKALEKFLKKAEKRIAEMKRKKGNFPKSENSGKKSSPPDMESDMESDTKEKKQ
jgi:hypothetical protein